MYKISDIRKALDFLESNTIKNISFVDFCDSVIFYGVSDDGWLTIDRVDVVRADNFNYSEFGGSVLLRK